MTAPNRFEIVAPLPSSRRHLHVAVDRGARPPCAVVLAFYPRAVSDDPARLERLSGEVERAARLFHPNVLAPVGIEAVGEDLAAVTVWRDAITLRELLDAGGRLPSDVAARIAADVCAGLAHAHGRPEPVVHGLLRPEAVLVDESGIAAVSGFGMPGGSGIADDLLGVAELLHECLVGEPPEAPSVPLEAPGVPVSLATVVNETRGAEREARHPTADALGAAIAQAVPLPPRETVAAYLEAIVPAGSGLRAERRRKIETVLAATPTVLREVSEEISEHDIVGAGTPLPGEVAAAPGPALTPAPIVVPAPTPIPARAPTPVPARVPAPAPAPAAAPAAASPSPSAAAISTSTGIATSASPVVLRTQPGTDAPAPTPRPTATATAPDPHPAGAHPVRGAARGPHVSLGVATGMCLAGVVIGFALGRLAPGNPFVEAPRGPAAAVRASADTRTSESVVPAVSVARTGTRPPAATRQPASKSAPDRKRSGVRYADATAYGSRAGMGLLDVTAPDGAEIWLDGRRIGKGSMRRQIPEGDHRVEVRHRGAVVGERFQVAPGESWTYAVTPQ